MEKGGGSPGRGRGRARTAPRPRARPPAALPTEERGGLLGGSAGASTHLARSSALCVSVLSLGSRAGWREGGERGASPRTPAFHLRNEFLHLRADSEKARCGPAGCTLPVWCLPPVQVPRDSPGVSLHRRSGHRNGASRMALSAQKPLQGLRSQMQAFDQLRFLHKRPQLLLLFLAVPSPLPPRDKFLLGLER